MHRLHSLQIGQVVGLGLGLILMLALLIGGLGWLAYQISRWENNTIRTRSDVERLSLQLEIISIEQTQALARYLESDIAGRLAEYQTKQSAYADTYSRLAPVLDSPEENEALRDVVAAKTSFEEKAAEILDLYNEGFPAAARFLWATEGMAARDQLLAATDRLRSVQGTISDRVIEETRRTENLAILAISVFIPLLLVGGVIASLLITRTITAPISNLVTTINQLRSDLTVRVSPSGPQEIAFLGESINEMAASLYSSGLSLQAYKNRLEQELALASQIQASVLPTDLPQAPGIELAVFWKSARELGGDFYACIALGDGQRGIAIGDVSGKGAPAAMAGALSVGLIEAYAFNHTKPETILSEMNRDLCSRLSNHTINVACCYALIDIPHKCLTVANAGCMYPYLFRDGSVHEIAARGMPLGAWEGFEYVSQRLPLQTGDLLIFSSDGLVEAKNHYGEMLGFERLQAELMDLSVKMSAQEAIDQLVKVAFDFTDPHDLHDDITILAARILD